MSEPAAGWLSEEQQRVWRSYLLANAHINEYLETALRAFDLSLAEYELLVRLSESPCHTIRMGELAASVGHSRSRLTHTVKRMEKALLVRREGSPDDGRGVVCRLTEQGHAMLRTAAPSHVETVRDSLIDLVEPADLAAFVAAVLGSLADDDARCEQLRETIRAFLAANCSYTETAKRTMFHRNTVYLRVQQAVDQYGLRLDADTLTVALALEICRWYGARVLSPVS